MSMIHEMIYGGVMRKAATIPPNELIGNVEMAAGAGIVLREINREMDFTMIQEPADIQKAFLDMINGYPGELSETSKIIVGLIQKYKVIRMVNETMEDLEILVKYQI